MFRLVPVCELAMSNQEPESATLTELDCTIQPSSDQFKSSDVPPPLTLLVMLTGLGVPLTESVPVVGAQTQLKPPTNAGRFTAAKSPT